VVQRRRHQHGQRHAAGALRFFDEAEYLKRISEEITELQSRPARQWQSADESSLDAWFEGMAFYRSPERSISTTTKVNSRILLDLRIRQFTNGA